MISYISAAYMEIWDHAAGQFQFNLNLISQKHKNKPPKM